MLASRWDPPDLPEARRWYDQAGAAGDVSAMHNLAKLLMEQDPPDVTEARRWYEQAAAAGHTAL